jgi:hypothetical protein
MPASILPVPSLVALALACLAAAPASAQLIHHYPFAADASDAAGSEDGTLEFEATVAGGVLTLDGMNDYVQFGPQIVPNSAPFSVAFFARQDPPVQSTFIEWISQGLSGPDGFYVGYSPGTAEIRLADNFGWTGVIFPVDGEFHHVAVTADGSVNRLYLDGVERASFAGAFDTTTAGTGTRLGRQFNVNGEYFRGDMDEVRIYAEALEACDIAELAAASGTPPWSSLGFGLAGLNGVPQLAGTGTLVAGSPGSLDLSGARELANAFLFVSLACNPTPFKGGVLVTVPFVQLFDLDTNTFGAVSLPFSWPSGLPGGTALHFQFAIQDADALKGVALSNALKAVQP